MHRHFRIWLCVLVIAAASPGCRTAGTPGTSADDGRHALELRIRAFRDEAMRGGSLTPARTAELRELAADARAYRARSGQDDIRVTQQTVPGARRNDDGGASECEDCAGYRLDGDRICFLEKEEACPVDDGSDLILGRVCVYTCLWIGSGAEPERKSARKEGPA